MEPLIMTTAITSIVSCVIGSIVGAVVASIKDKKTNYLHDNEVERAKQDALYKGVRTILRNEIIGMHREYVEDKGEITYEALDYAEDTYTAYHDLGGNGSGTKLWTDIKNLPVKE